MNKIIFVFTLALIPFICDAQTDVAVLNDNGVGYNKWSLELNVGNNKPLRPFSSGYYTSNPNSKFNFNSFSHFDIGARYMLSNIFGLKMDLAFDLIKNKTSSGSIEFKNNQYRLGLQGVTNLSRLMHFETFTGRLGLLAHGGVQVARRDIKSGVNKNLSEDNGGLIFGLTPQFRITDKIVVTADFTVINNVRQHFNWDGTYSATDNNLTGIMYNTSLGLTFYLGENNKHSDWYVNNEQKVDDEARKRLDDIETLMNDTDKDGIADYLDQENNTPAGVAVDSRGKYVDLNKNGVPDELERNKLDTNIITTEKIDVIKEIISKGYVNIFFDTNNDEPNSSSVNDVYFVIQYLRLNPGTKIKLTGYADVRGNEKKNVSLSQRRAENLYKIIISSNIDKDRVKVIGQGVDTSHFQNYKTNLDLARRVSITIE